MKEWTNKRMNKYLPSIMLILEEQYLQGTDDKPT